MTTTERLMQLAEAWVDAAKEAARSEEIDTAAIYAMHVGLRCEAEAAFRSALSSTLEAPADVREVAEKAIASWMIDWEPFEQGGYEHRGLIEAIDSALTAYGTAQRAAGVEACKNAVCEHCRKNIPICKTWRDFHQYEGFVAQCLAAAIRNGEGTK